MIIYMVEGHYASYEGDFGWNVKAFSDETVAGLFAIELNEIVEKIAALDWKEDAKEIEKLKLQFNDLAGQEYYHSDASYSVYPYEVR